MGELNALRAQLDGIEQTQGEMRAELESLKMDYVGVTGHWATEVVEEDDLKARIDALEKKLNETVRLE